MSALQWVRSRQRDLTRAVLALFCLAWLQAAAVPCVMAADMAPPAGHHCQYCPPALATPDAGHNDTCTYPHEPQVDSRVASGLFFVVPVTPVIALLDARPVETTAAEPSLDTAAASPRLAVSYCRFIL